MLTRTCDQCKQERDRPTASWLLLGFAGSKHAWVCDSECALEWLTAREYIDSSYAHGYWPRVVGEREVSEEARAQALEFIEKQSRWLRSLKSRATGGTDKVYGLYDSAQD